jgi:transcriptional regulator with XRE-family HTH domain
MRETREKQRLTQQALAERVADLGVPIDRATIARIETGTRGVSLDDALLLAAALNVAPVHLFTPMDDDAPVAVAPKAEAPAHRVRDWVRGQGGPLLDPEPGPTPEHHAAYFTEIPVSEWAAYDSLGMRAVLRHIQFLARAAAAGDTDAVRAELAAIEDRSRHYREHGIFAAGLESIAPTTTTKEQS